MINKRHVSRCTTLSVASLLLLGSYGALPVHAASSDLAPQGGNLLDAFAKLAGAGYLGESYSARDFYSSFRYTRAELALILDNNLLGNSDILEKAETSRDVAPQLVGAVESLQPELKADGVDVEALKSHFPKYGSTVDGYIQPEYRGENGNPVDSDPKSLLIYRATAAGLIGSNSRYVISSTNSTLDSRNLFTNDRAVDDAQGLNEAYVEWTGKHGLTLDAGRMLNNWGPEYLGSPLLSDNSPAMDQLKIAFPFSLGKRLGRNYDYTELASTFSEDSLQKYFLARRINYQANSRLNFEFQEAIKSSVSSALLFAPLPFASKSANWSKLPGSFGSIDNETNYVFDVGAGYQPTATSRVYTQFLVDDLKSPFGSSDKVVPRKIAYIVGTSFRPLVDTGITLEYGYADPTTYTFNSSDAVWQDGAGNGIGMPYGPNSRDLYARIDQKISDKLKLTLDARSRDRASDSFPQPSARAEQAAATYSLNKKNWIGLSYENYRQDPFPYQPGSAQYPTPNNYLPGQTTQGNRIRLQELDVSYGIAF